jgi:hypothetical protein
VSAHRAPSLERVPAAPPPPSLPPAPLAPPAADGSPLVGSGPIRRWTDGPLSTSPHRTGTRRPSRRSLPPTRKWTPRRCAPTARPASSASRPRRPPSLPPALPPLFLLPPTGPHSWGLGRSAGYRSDPSPGRLTQRARGDRQDAPRRQCASGRQEGERPPRAQPRARPGRAAPPTLCSSCRRRVPSRGVWTDPQVDGWTPLYIASCNGHEATVKTLLAANAQVDAKKVSAHRAPSLERVPAAPSPPPSLPLPPPPLLLLPPTGPLSWALGRSAGYRSDPSLHRLTGRARGNRQDAPRRQGASGRQGCERPPRAQPRARPGRAAPPTLCSSCRRRVPSLVGFGPIRRMADGPLSSPPLSTGTRRPSRRSSPPTRKWTPRRCTPTARPASSASRPRHPPLPPARSPPPPCSSLCRRVPTHGVWADLQANGSTPLYVASQKGHEATVKTLLAAKAQVDAKKVRAHRAPSLERVPAAPPHPPSLPPPPPVPPAADGSPLVGSGPIRRRTERPLSTSPLSTGTRRPSRRSSPPRRKWTPRW